MRQESDRSREGSVGRHVDAAPAGGEQHERQVQSIEHAFARGNIDRAGAGLYDLKQHSTVEAFQSDLKRMSADLQKSGVLKGKNGEDLEISGIGVDKRGNGYLDIRPVDQAQARAKAGVPVKGTPDAQDPKVTKPAPPAES